MKYDYKTWRDFYHDQWVFSHNALVHIEEKFSHNKEIMKIINKQKTLADEQDCPKDDAIDYSPKNIRNRWRTFRKTKCPSK